MRLIRGITVGNQKCGCGIGALDFETLGTVVGGCCTDVVEDAGGEEEGVFGLVCEEGGIGFLGEGFGVQVDSETVVQDGWGEEGRCEGEGGLGDWGGGDEGLDGLEGWVWVWVWRGGGGGVEMGGGGWRTHWEEVCLGDWWEYLVVGKIWLEG